MIITVNIASGQMVLNRMESMDYKCGVERVWDSEGMRD